jgi:hypothetical protein
VYAASSIHPNRKLVEEARKGDWVVHYDTPFIRALSRAQTNGTWAFNVVHAQEGWTFATEYYEFRNPIHRDRVIDELMRLSIEDGPFEKRRRVKQGYFYRFSESGLAIIRNATEGDWPDWAT